MKRIQLWDSFNNVLISKHNTLEGAILKQRKHLKKVKKANGQNSYLTYSFKYASGQEVEQQSINRVKYILDKCL